MEQNHQTIGEVVGTPRSEQVRGRSKRERSPELAASGTVCSKKTSAQGWSDVKYVFEICEFLKNRKSQGIGYTVQVKCKSLSLFGKG